MTDPFVNPFNDRRLLAYYEQVYYWHGYIRFLGLPHLKDRPDVPIERLYVVPDLSEQRIAPEDPTGAEKLRKPLLETLKDNPRLVLLGDPGSGKSTLVSWIAYQLTRSESPYVRALGPRVPLPLVLRDLPLGGDLDWDDLLAAFLDRPVARDLDRETVEALLARGQAFVLLDGLDELGGRRKREAVGRAILEGLDRYPNCRWLATSRIVGYEEAPLHRLGGDDPWSLLGERYSPGRCAAEARSLPKGRASADWLRTAKSSRLPTILEAGDLSKVEDAAGAHDRQSLLRLLKWVRTDEFGSLFYVAPFSDPQIDRFAQAWHARYQESPEQGREKARDLVRAIHGSPATHSLARVPNLLTLMALIHRIQATLPHGRAILYGKIAEAYLESIDTFYGLGTQGYSLEEKKRWLAKVGFEMQKRRAEAKPGRAKDSQEREILVEEAVLLSWLQEVMEDSPAAGPQEGTPEERARAFVRYVARRSGLLLPRGEDAFAFTHLSFQEYFAAEYLADRITGPRWFDRKSDAGDGPEDLERYADDPDWHETLLLLFGLFAGRPEWSKELSALLFGEGFSKLFTDEARLEPTKPRRALLLAEISMDPHSGLPRGTREEAWRTCWRWDLGRFNAPASERLEALKTSLAHHLLATSNVEEHRHQLEVLGACTCDVEDASLDLSGYRPVLGWDFVAELQDLHRLSIAGTDFSDLRLLAHLSDLRSLNLENTSVTDLEPLSLLGQLETLFLGGTRVTDLSPLSSLTRLQILVITDTGVKDLSPLYHLQRLELLLVDGSVSTGQWKALEERLPRVQKLHVLQKIRRDLEDGKGRNLSPRPEELVREDRDRDLR